MTTAHSHPMVFGRRVAGCPRCAELDAGAPPVRWSSQRSSDARRVAEIRAHDCRRSNCGVVCTFGDP